MNPLLSNYFTDALIEYSIYTTETGMFILEEEWEFLKLYLVIHKFA